MRNQLTTLVQAGLMMALLLSGSIKAQTVSGKVTDADTKAGLAGVMVTEKGTANSTTTGSTGSFTLNYSGTVGNIPVSPQALQGTVDWRKARISISTVSGSRVGTEMRAADVKAMLPQLADGIYLVTYSINGQQAIGKMVKADIYNTFSVPTRMHRVVTGKTAGAPTVVMEAESMSLNGYVLDTGTKLNGTAIMVNPNLGTGASGSATKTFTGTSGNYTVIVSTIPENDGQPIIKVSVGSNVIMNEQLPIDDGNFNYTKREDYTITGVAINNGDVIKIDGTADAQAWARVDKITFQDVATVTLVFSKSGLKTKEVTTEWGASGLAVELSKVISGDMPTKQWIIDNAGPSNPSLIKPGTPDGTKEGAIIENMSFGGLSISANNVTIRNCRIVGNGNGGPIIKPERGVTGTVVENCYLETTIGPKSSTGCVGFFGKSTTVRHCEITGWEADGIKVESGTPDKPSLYEYNYIHMKNPPGAEKHLDGIQASGDSYFIIQYNVIDQPCWVGSNSCIIMTAWASQCVHSYDNIARNNYVRGGNYVIYAGGGKEEYCSNAASYAHNFQVIDNIFSPGSKDKTCPEGGSGIRYGYFSITGDVTLSGNIFEDGTPVPGQ